LKNTCSQAPRLTSIRLASRRNDLLNRPRRKRGGGVARNFELMDMAEAAWDLKQAATLLSVLTCLPSVRRGTPEGVPFLLLFTGRRPGRRRNPGPTPSE